jgi:hypothetical protein
MLRFGVRGYAWLVVEAKEDANSLTKWMAWLVVPSNGSRPASWSSRRTHDNGSGFEAF